MGDLAIILVILLKLFCIGRFSNLLVKKLLVMKFLGKEISLTIMILDIFIREYFNISPVVMFRTMEQKAAGMLCLKRNQELICRKEIK